jgi:hypothetical protein
MKENEFLAPYSNQLPDSINFLLFYCCLIPAFETPKCLPDSLFMLTTAPISHSAGWFSHSLDFSCSFAVLGIEPRTSGYYGNTLALEPCTQPFCFTVSFVRFLRQGVATFAWAGLQLAMLLPPPPE